MATRRSHDSEVHPQNVTRLMQANGIKVKLAGGNGLGVVPMKITFYEKRNLTTPWRQIRLLSQSCWTIGFRDAGLTMVQILSHLKDISAILGHAVATRPSQPKQCPRKKTCPHVNTKRIPGYGWVALQRHPLIKVVYVGITGPLQRHHRPEEIRNEGSPCLGCCFQGCAFLSPW